MTRPAAPSAPPSWGSAALWAFGLGAFFFLVYGGTNWLTSSRTDVGTLFFSWERMIPFVPVLIIPYMSIDLFFVGALFLCTSSRQLLTLAKRVIFAILLSGAGFLLIPLRFAFERPPVSGFLGSIFGVLGAFDRPYNLVPSLHISLLGIIRVVYRQRAQGWRRAVLEVWFMLIAISTVLTYQHHVLDVVTGAAVAILAFLLFPEPQAKGDARADRSGAFYRRLFAVGSRYLVLAGIFSLAAYAAWPWTAILAWLAIALAVVSLAYFGAKPGAFRKSGGVIPLWMRVIVAPYHLGVALSHVYYRRGHSAYAEVVPSLLIGRRLSETEARVLIRTGLRAVLDLTCEMSESKALRRMNYHNVQILDLTVPTSAQLAEAVRFLRQHRTNGPVYIHCALGYSRSACVAAAYLLAEGVAATVGEAIQMVRNARPEIVIEEDLAQALAQFLATPRPVGGPSLMAQRVRTTHEDPEPIACTR